MGRADFDVRRLSGTLEESMAPGAVEELLAKLETHPSMKAASHEQDAAAALVELADRMRIPDVSVELMYRRYQEADEDTVDVGIGVEVPLMDGGGGRRRAARAEESAAAARKAATREAATREELRARVMEAHAGLARAIAAAKVMKEEVLPAAKRVLDAVEKRHAAGDASLAEVLPVRGEWSGLRMEYAKELREVAVAWAELKGIAP
jgi:outer membrane protein TolC